MRVAIGVLLGLQAATISAAIVCPTFVTSYAAISVGLLSLVLLALVAKSIFKLRATNDRELEEIIQQRTSVLIDMVKQYERAASTDALTGLLNRRGGEDSITHHVARSRRLRTSFSFILVDIDKFKEINDRYGHAIGDVVISGVARVLIDNLRLADFAIRWGGEEFLVCLPDTDLEGAVLVAEKLRSAIEETDFDIPKVTASFGCSELGFDQFSIALARADMHLYFAKARGRNRVFPDSVKRMLDIA